MRKIIVGLLASIVALASFSAVLADDPTPVPPSAKLNFTKSGQLSDHIIVWTISIVNSGNADSSPQTIQDILPAGVYWSVATVEGLDCTLSPYIVDTTRQILNCDTETVPKAYFDDTLFSIVSGIARVHIYGYAEQCGLYRNIAVRNGIDVVVATVDVPCPPTPVPTATPTQTQIPSTPIPATNTPTMTPVPNTPIPTSTPRIIPLPPNTGNSSGSDAVVKSTYIIIFSGSLLILIGLVTAAIIGRPRK